jgi:hypothetical protein
VSGQPEVTQRDLRNRSKQIMDAVAHGHAFTVMTANSVRDTNRRWRRSGISSPI